MIEQSEMVRSAVRLLVARGCGRLAVVSHGSPFPGFSRFWEGFVCGLNEHGLVPDEAQNITGSGIQGIAGGQQAAERILALPTALRPDGIIVVDDWLAMGLAATLRQTLNYRPRLAVQTNLQIPLAFALPVLRFDVDIHELARKGVELFFDLLRNPQQPAKALWVYPRLASEEALEMARELASAPGSSPICLHEEMHNPR